MNYLILPISEIHRGTFWKSLPVLCFTVFCLTSCNPEPFDPASAQQQMTGSWSYVEEKTNNACRMQIGADGSDGLTISNFACSGLTIKATLISESRLNIPYQVVDGDIFEGSGEIKKYKTMVLQFTYDDGRENLNIVANCTKL